jgi:hypothetical protein
MEILESWLNKMGEAYAVVRDSAGAYRAVWELDGELYDFGGSPGLNTAKFDTIDEATVFLLTGFEHQEDNPEIFLQMLEVKPSSERLPF